MLASTTMDSHFDSTAAANALEQSACINSESPDTRLSSLITSNKWMKGIQVVQIHQPNSWRLMSVEDGNNDETGEECVFRLQGILCAKELPPLMVKPTSKAGRFKYLRQSITMTGLGSPTFERAVNAINEIFGVFERNFMEGTLEPWKAPSHTDGKSSCLEVSNRYFTPCRDAPDMQSIPFHPLVDPKGILAAMERSTELVKHGEENEVEYYDAVIISGDRKMTRSGPHIFRIGDIVEAQLSFVVVPMQNNTFKLKLILRSAAVIDSTFSRVSVKLVCMFSGLDMERMKSVMKSVEPNVRWKLITLIKASMSKEF